MTPPFMATKDVPRGKEPLSDEQTPEAMTLDEINGAAAHSKCQSSSPSSTSKRPNAFTELMSAAKKPKPTPTIAASDIPRATRLAAAAAPGGGYEPPQYGLRLYLEHPEKNPEGSIVEYDDEFVVIRDKFPKASVHLLLLPRDPAIYFQEPSEYLSKNPEFLDKIRARVAHLKRVAADELRRQYGKHSATDAPYLAAVEEAMSSPDAPASPAEITTPLPEGRDWESEILAGIHTHPSMHHMHIHILSREMHSERVKRKKQYLSFQSSFLIQMHEFPLEEGSARFHPGPWPDWDMLCWRCGRNFGQKFAALKRHLEEEFEEWKKA